MKIVVNMIIPSPISIPLPIGTPFPGIIEVIGTKNELRIRSSGIERSIPVIIHPTDMLKCLLVVMKIIMDVLEISTFNFF